MDVAMYGGPHDGGEWKQVPPHEDEIVVPGSYKDRTDLHLYRRNLQHPSRFDYAGPAPQQRA